MSVYTCLLSKTDVWPYSILNTLLGAVLITYLLLLGAVVALYFLTKNLYILVTDIQTRKNPATAASSPLSNIRFFWNLELPWWC